MIQPLSWDGIALFTKRHRTYCVTGLTAPPVVPGVPALTRFTVGAAVLASVAIHAYAAGTSISAVLAYATDDVCGVDAPVAAPSRLAGLAWLAVPAADADATSTVAMNEEVTSVT